MIISDYDKGFLHEDDIQWICENNNNVFVDTKKKLGDWIKDVDFLKINDLEYENNKHFFENNPIIDKTIITRGREGCLFKGDRYPTDDVPVKDISGAGDTFLAGLTTEYIRSRDIIKAINALFEIRHVFGSPYHPQAQATIETTHGALNNILR